MRAVVTDSTWSLPPALAAATGIRVLPLHVEGQGTSLLDTPDLAQEVLAGRFSTSQPSPAELRAVLEEARADGALEIVSLHISALLSGTVSAMEVQGREFTAGSGIAVHVVDTRTTGAGLGYAVLVVAASVNAGDPVRVGVARARECASRSRVLLTVDDLRHLQRGGRLSATPAVIGAALGIKPILEIREGALKLREPVRGTVRAREQLVKRAVAGTAPERVSLAVHHAGALDAAAALAEDFVAAAESHGDTVERVDVTPMSAVLAVHAGPGALAVVRAPTFGLVEGL